MTWQQFAIPTVLAVALYGVAGPARGQDDGRSLGQRLRQDLPPSAPIERVQLEGSTKQIPGAERSVTGEKAVAEPPDIDQREGPRAVSLDQAAKLLDNLDLERRSTELRHCRVEVALEHRIAVSLVVAEEVAVRFTVAPDGKVDGVAVLAVKPAEPDVLGCVQHKVAAWRFVREPCDRLELSFPLAFAPPPREPQRTPNR